MVEPENSEIKENYEIDHYARGGGGEGRDMITTLKITIRRLKGCF